MSGDTEMGAREILHTALQHPATAVAMVCGLLAGTALGSAAYLKINSDLAALQHINGEQAQQIRAVKDQVHAVDQRSSDKLDGLQRDLSDVKVGLQRVLTSTEFLIRQSGPERR